MPELPEVEIVRRSLDKKIKQKKVKKVIIRNRNLRLKIPLNFASYLKNQKIIKSIPITLNKMSFFEFIKLSELKFEKQNIIKINENDTEETLKDRLQEIEHRLYSDTIKSILIKNQ